jgi:hypothetical protein
MTPLQNFTAALHLAFAVLIFGVLVLKLFHDYRIDALRDRLFALREELFDYAVEGKVSFDDPAYFRLRQLINSLIRFAHRLTVTRLFVGEALTSRKWREVFGNPLLDWQKSVESLPKEQRQRLETLHMRVLETVVRHLVTGSPLLVACLIIFVLGAIIKGLTETSLELATRMLSPQLDALQMQAIAADVSDRQSRELAAAH